MNNKPKVIKLLIVMLALFAIAVVTILAFVLPENREYPESVAAEKNSESYPRKDKDTIGKYGIGKPLIPDLKEKIIPTPIDSGKDFAKVSTRVVEHVKNEKSLSWIGSHWVTIIFFLLLGLIAWLAWWLWKKGWHDNDSSYHRTNIDRSSEQTKANSREIHYNDNDVGMRSSKVGSSFYTNPNEILKSIPDIPDFTKHREEPVRDDRYESDPPAVTEEKIRAIVKEVLKEERASLPSLIQEEISKHSEAIENVQSIQHVIGKIGAALSKVGDFLSKVAKELLEVSKKTESSEEFDATHTIVQPVQPKPLTEKNLISWWNTNSSKKFTDCKQSLKETFGDDIIVELAASEDRDVEDWYMIGIKKRGINSYYIILPRRLCSYTRYMKGWFSTPTQVEATNLSIVSLKKPAKARDISSDSPINKGIVEVGR